uniref:Uncharacterized protein n=1 Tax=Cucumis sativus TaxID=3659 RepID=A0A0A0LE17_CUCSA
MLRAILSDAFIASESPESGAVGLTTGVFFQHLKRFRKVHKKPGSVSFRSGFSFGGAGSHERRRFFHRRLRSRFDLTLPIHETFGDEGSTSAESDFSEDPDCLGNSLVFPDFAFRRLFESTKQVL